jgi:hypothetical protein
LVLSGQGIDSAGHRVARGLRRRLSSATGVEHIEVRIDQAPFDIVEQRRRQPARAEAGPNFEAPAGRTTRRGGSWSFRPVRTALPDSPGLTM